MLSHSCCIQLFVTLQTATCQALLSMGFSRQEYWNGLPFPTSGSSRPKDWTYVFYIYLHLQLGYLPLAPPGKLYDGVQFSSVAQSCQTVCERMDCSTPGFSVHHQLPELAQTHVHWVSDAIQPSHLLSSPSLPAFNLSQHQGLFQWVSSSHQVAKVL